MLLINEIQRARLLEEIDLFRREVNMEILTPISRLISDYTHPNEIRIFMEELKKLIDAFNTPIHGSIELDSEVLPMLKRVIMTRRRLLAAQIEEFKIKTFHPEIHEKLDSQCQPLDELLSNNALKDVTSFVMPRLSDFISIGQMNEFTTTSKTIQREYDEKFHILQAPKLFLHDLALSRRECELRNLSTVVAYIDIDDFKTKFNTQFGEVTVDRDVLPQFMQEIEAHVFSHGYAYRIGGDEYILLLPNLALPLATKFLDDLRRNLSLIDYRNIEEKTTVSIGFVVVDSDSLLTDREIEERANAAKNYAKSKKNCLATFNNKECTQNSLFIIDPENWTDLDRQIS